MNIQLFPVLSCSPLHPESSYKNPDRWFSSPEQIPRTGFAESKGVSVVPQRGLPSPAATKTLCWAKSRRRLDTRAPGAGQRSGQRASHQMAPSLMQTAKWRRASSCLRPCSARPHLVGSSERGSHNERPFGFLPLRTGSWALCKLCLPAELSLLCWGACLPGLLRLQTAGPPGREPEGLGLD